MESTIAALERNAGLIPGATAVIGERHVLSYGELYARVSECARFFGSIAARRAVLIADNSPDWIVADLAAQLAGIVLIPVPGFFSAAQLRHALGNSGADVVVTDRNTAPRLGQLIGERVGAATDGLDCFRPGIPAGHVTLPASTAKISYTSGTTGEPKGACLTQDALDRVAASLIDATADLTLRRHLCLLPLALLLENLAGVYAPLRNGGEISVPSLASIGWIGAVQLDAERALERIRRLQPDSAILVPQMLNGLVAALERGAEAPRTLSFVAVGGARVAPALLDRAERLGLPIFEGYGLTETASVVALCSPKQRRRGSVGRPLAHARVRIDDRGEIRVSGAIFSGYVGAEARALDEVATGDLGRIDEDGYLYVLGRRKNVFITSFGRNVSPDWVEAELARASSIAQIAMFGEARPWNVAVVVPTASASPEQVQSDIAAVNASLPDYARIGDWIAAAEPFTPANGLSTGNGRNRRDAIWRAYAQQINARYDDCLSRAV